MLAPTNEAFMQLATSMGLSSVDELLVEGQKEFLTEVRPESRGCSKPLQQRTHPAQGSPSRGAWLYVESTTGSSSLYDSLPFRVKVQCCAHTQHVRWMQLHQQAADRTDTHTHTHTPRSTSAYADCVAARCLLCVCALWFCSSYAFTLGLVLPVTQRSCKKAAPPCQCLPQISHCRPAQQMARSHSWGQSTRQLC